MTTTTNTERIDHLLSLGSDVILRARKQGADVAEVMLKDSIDLSAKVRLQQPELIEEASSHGIGLRVMMRNRSASAYTSDPSRAGLDTLVANALELAALSEPDEFANPPDPSSLERVPRGLDLCDPEPERIDARDASERACRAEGAAKDVDARINNSEGSTFARSFSAHALVTSGGFAAGYCSSNFSIDVNPVADDAGGKKRPGSYWDFRRHLADLASETDIGVKAARRTLDKIGARKISSCEVPAVFEPEAGRALLSLFFSCVSGTGIYQRASYLVGREGDAVASDLVTIVDDPLLLRGPGSRPFDGEGLPSRRNVVVDRGVLKTYLLDTYSARKLDRASTGSATRGIAGRIGVAPSNFCLAPGNSNRDAIVEEIDRGLYVTSMMGFGFNAVTGDFSRGAEGFWIERGEKTFPVGEITISLNFNDLWKRIDAVGNDFELKSSFAAPTLRVSRVTIAGT